MNDFDELRALVREVIRDVLPDGLPGTETVNLSTDEDLTAFVKRLPNLDPDQREELRSGRKRFRLATAPTASPWPAPVATPVPVQAPRRCGVLEVHGRDLDDVRRAGQAILDGLGADEKDQLRPRILFSDVIGDVTDAHAIIVNRNRSGSMIIPGETLGVSEVTPALFAAVAANEAERAAPGVTPVDVSMIGAAGRIYLSGRAADVRRAQDEITKVLWAVAGRDHGE